MITQTLRIKGMHCASCANIIEKTLNKTKGVFSIEVNSGTESAKISFDENKTNIENLSKKIEPLGYSFISPIIKDKNKELSATKNILIFVIPLAIISILIMIWDILAQYKIIFEMNTTIKTFLHNLLPIMATYTLFVTGRTYILGIYRFLRYGKANMDTLIGIGTLAAFLYSFILYAFEDILRPFLNVNQSYFDITIVVIAFITLGKYLEARSKIKTGDAIEKLLNLQAKTALVIRNKKEIEIPIEQVMLGEIIIIKPGNKIPVDGIIIEGSSYIDESMITGEPMPIGKNIGDSVSSGTVNTNGSFNFQATKIGSETMLARIIQMVQNAQNSRAPIQALADKISSIFVPFVLILAFIALGLWLSVGVSYLGFSQALSYGLMCFVGILVIACPCALGLATPTAIIVGVGKGAREGILIKDASTLEKLHKVNTVVVDKTGTLTIGKPTLISIQSFSEKTDDELLIILASLENKSEHPIAHSINTYAKNKKLKILPIENFEAIKGKGLKAKISEIEYYVGNTKLIKDLNINFNINSIQRETTEGKTPVIISTKEKVLGVIMIADMIKKEVKEAIAKLHKMGIKIVMLTGDNQNTADYIAKQIGIDETIAEFSPEDKLKKIKSLQNEGNIVAMVGDGINDAPALAQADVGIAMATGTDVAIESAGITLLHGDILKLVKAIKLSKLTMRGIKQNLFWAFFYNIIGIPLAGGLFYPIFGWLLSPVLAGMTMAFSSVSVVSNSLRLKTKKL